jgi:hypothetical protein
MARLDLTNKQIEAMHLKEPGSAARYLEERRQEIEAERQKKRDEDDRQRFVEAYVRAGGSRSDAATAFKAHRNEQAAAAARQADKAAVERSRRRARQKL